MSRANELKSTPIGRKPTEGPETAYTRAQKAWDDRLGGVVQQSRNWRLAAFASLALSGGLIALNFFQAGKRTVEPAIVRVEDSGKAVYVGKATEQVYVPQQNEIRYFLNDILQKLRTVPLDPIVLRQNWLTSYNFLRQGAANKLDAWATGPESPSLFVGKRTITVQTVSVVPVTKSTYEIRWEETAYGLQGNIESIKTYTGTFAVEIQRPTTEEQIARNPLGLFIKDFSWHIDMNSAS